VALLPTSGTNRKSTKLGEMNAMEYCELVSLIVLSFDNMNHVLILHVFNRYKRQKKERELAKKRKERQKKADDEKDHELEAWLSKWAEKEVVKAAAITKHLTRILNDAETKEERAERKQLLKEIKVNTCVCP